MNDWIHTSQGRLTAFVVLALISMFAVVQAEHHINLERITKLQKQVQVINKEIPAHNTSVTKVITTPGKPGINGKNGKIITTTITITKTVPGAEIPGPRGPRGFTGATGREGKQGIPGKQGVQGIPGVGPSLAQVISRLCAKAPALFQTLCQAAGF